MPLPLLAAAPAVYGALAGVVTGAAASYAVSKASDKSSGSSADPDWSNKEREGKEPKKHTVSDEAFSDILFGVKLLVSVCHVDGEKTKEEDEALEKILKEAFYNNYHLSEEQRNEIGNEKDAGYTDMAALSKAFRATNSLENISIVMDALEKLVKADRCVEDEEKWFVLKCRLAFARGLDVPLFVVSERKFADCVYDFVKVLTPEEFDRDYSWSRAEKEPHDQLLTLYPGSGSELVPLEEMAEIDIGYDRETEILEVMRLVGAKRVLITLSDKKLTESDILSKAEANLEIKKVEVGSSGEMGSSSASQLEENEMMEVVFTKDFVNFIRIPYILEPKNWRLKKLMNESKWLASDKKVSWLIHQSLDSSTGNNASSFLHESSLQDEATKVLEVSGALEASGLGAKGSVSGERKDRLKNLTQKRRYLYAEFH